MEGFTSFWDVLWLVLAKYCRDKMNMNAIWIDELVFETVQKNEMQRRTIITVINYCRLMNKWIKYFSQEGGWSLIMAMSTGACWGRHFCVEPGIFVSNRTFLCRTMHFAVEPGFFVSNECYNNVYQLSTLTKSEKIKWSKWNISTTRNAHVTAGGWMKLQSGLYFLPC